MHEDLDEEKSGVPILNINPKKGLIP